MRAPLLVAAMICALVGAAGCVDGVTPDCSKANCGTPTSDGGFVPDATADGASDATSDANEAGADAGTDARDGSVDAKTD
jgi:hypothetical protein